MKIIKKLKGGFHPFLTEDEKLLSTTNSRNTVYVYNLEDNKQLYSLKTVSNVSKTALSKDQKLLAAKNTSGTISVIRLETQEEVCQSTMEGREGYNSMLFMPDNDTLLDCDWDGRTMLLDCLTGKHDILDGPGHGIRNLPKISHMAYDVYTNQIYKFVFSGPGSLSGDVLASPACADNIEFHPVQTFQNAMPKASDGISFCRTKNYYMDRRNNQLVAADKNFLELFRKNLPERGITSVDTIWVSANEKYLFMNFGKQCDYRDFAGMKTAKSLSCLYALDTMELVAEFDYDYVSDFLMFDDDRKFVLATWQGSYLGEI